MTYNLNLGPYDDKFLKFRFMEVPDVVRQVVITFPLAKKKMNTYLQ